MVFVYPYRIDLADTDAAGVIYFAKAFEMCHSAYEHYLATWAIALPEIVKSYSIALPIVHSEADFFQPLFWGDRVLVKVTSEPPRPHSFELAYQITPENQPDAIAISARTRHVCINPQTRQKALLPEVLLKAIGEIKIS
ncbi:MAG: thioesterase family protein [Jaaginema sp. PMC 1080.18]|nr:thioesterase family protein [Jaaginema sp. PMC 1080.18]MEC4868128.1 thioesterase family protein [Jaaginema sp. PMC 1078.18]